MEFTIIDQTKPEGKNVVPIAVFNKRIARIAKRLINDINDRYMILDNRGYVYTVSQDKQIRLPLSEAKKKAREQQEIKNLRFERKQLKKQLKQERVEKAQLKKQLSERRQAIRETVQTARTLSDFIAIIRNLAGNNVNTLAINDQGEEIVNRVLQVPNTDFAGWWNSAQWWYMQESDRPFMEDNTGTYYVYPEDIVIGSTEIRQAFRAGVSNRCMLEPIRAWVEGKMAELREKEMSDKKPSSRTKERYERLERQMSEIWETYANGVPDNKIDDITKRLQIDIEIETPFAKSPFLVSRSPVKCLKKFCFLNTRLNHVDPNQIVQETKPQIVERDELRKIMDKCEKEGIWATYKKDTIGICGITTLTESYTLSNDYATTVNEFEHATGMNQIKLDDMDDLDISSFVREGVHYNATVDFKKIRRGLNHIDMRAAYANFKECPQYEGFLGKITDFRPTDRIQGVGLYDITDLDFSEANPKFVAYNDKLRIFSNNVVYTSAELRFLDSQGVRYRIVAGCWGVKPFSFDFSADMLQKKTPEGVAYYAKFIGQCNQIQHYRRFWFRSNNRDYLSHLRSGSDYEISIFGNEVSATIKKQHCYHLSHITAFVLAYQRLNVLDQLLSMDINNVVRVCVDGIFYEGEPVECRNVFRAKPSNKIGNEAGDSYISNGAGIEKWYDSEIIKRDTYAKELFLGAGGNGKTHYNLTDKGLIKPLYVAPSWKLARNKNNDYGVACQVLANVATSDPDKINMILSKYNVLIFDEVSMYSNEAKECIFEKYGQCRLIFCGDLGYQLPCVNAIPMNEEGFDKITTFTKNYRCSDKALLDILETLREYIRTGAPNDLINNYVKTTFKNLGQVLTTDEAIKMYNINDMILASTNEIKNIYTEILTGKFAAEKYYITGTNRSYSNGDIVISETRPDNCECVVRHCFTVHSIQGETCETRLFIDGSKWFDDRMIYTALSRARRLDQIFIVIEQEQEVPQPYKYREINQYAQRELGISLNGGVSLSDKAELFERAMKRKDITDEKAFIMLGQLNRGVYIP